MGDEEREAANQIEAIFAKLSARQRTEAMTLVHRRYCEGCGDPQPLHGYCQCSNDE